MQNVDVHPSCDWPSATIADKKLTTWSTSNINMRRVSRCYGPGDSTAAVGEL